ncbi:4,4'-diaponeurosporenoate glycosyltransferase [Phycisphaerae bacterium RAS1]|nr:4,4'-diaponeurosporenoate glycosyltransferase [Phycisphaerae bacterium RAS1]
MPLAALLPQFSSTWLAVWFWATLVICLVWLRRHIDLLLAGRDRDLAFESERLTDAASAPLPRLSMLVAGKDEEANIGRCVEGLLRQDYPNLQVIAIDDRSGDRTGEIIDRIALHDARFTALHVSELTPGWFGKNNAMRLGVEHADGELLCFTDADCTFDSPRLLTAAVRLMLRDNVDFLSVLPLLEAGSFWERVVQPVAGGIMVVWFPPQRVNNPRSACAYANGAFMLMSRRTYDALGGHEPVKATLNEDMHLARLTKRAGLRLRVIRSGGMYRVRMYTGFRQIWRGWSRIFFGCFGTFPKLLGSVLMLTIFSLSPWLSLFIAGGAWLAGSAHLGPIAAMAAAAVTAQQSVLWRFYTLSGVGSAWALSYPVGAVVCLGMTLSAITRLGGSSTNWRGTTYEGGAHRERGSVVGS